MMLSNLTVEEKAMMVDSLASSRVIELQLVDTRLGKGFEESSVMGVLVEVSAMEGEVTIVDDNGDERMISMEMIIGVSLVGKWASVE